MTDLNETQPTFDDSPTTPAQPPYPLQAPTPIPPRGPEMAPPPAWQPAGSAGGPVTEPISWTPAGQQPPAARRSGRGRWIVALLGALLIVVAAAGVAVFALSSKSTAAVGPTFLPPSTPLYAEVRLDLPGGQRDSVIKLLAHFPGFADPSTFDKKWDNAFDKLVGKVTSAITYTTDIKPWFGGQIAVGLLQVPSSLSGSATPGAAIKAGALEADAAQVHAVIGITIKDRSQLDTLLTTIRAVPGSLTFSQEQYGDHTVVTAMRDGAAVGAYSLSDTLLLIAASPTDLKTSLDILDGKQPSLASDTGFSTAMKNLPAERLGAVYVGPSFSQAMAGTMSGLSGLSGMTGATDINAQALQCLSPGATDATNARFAAAIVANGDNITLQGTSTGGSAMATRTATDLAAHAPSDAIFYAEIPKVGASIHDVIACLRTAMPDAFSGDQVAQVEKLLGTKLEDYLSFVTDVGISVTDDGKTIHWGLVATVDNADTATQRVTTLVSAAKLAAGLGQAPITVTDQQVNGATVSTITVTNTGSTANLPIETSLSVAVSGGHLYLGDGDFAAAAIGRAAADSLGSSARYTSALAAAGSPNGAIVYVDVSAVRQQIEAAIHPDQNYVTNTQPYLAPFDRLIIGSNQDANGLTGRVVLFVK